MAGRFRLRLSDGREFAGRSDQTLLQQLQAAGCKVPSACRNGHCGRCYANLRSGSLSVLTDRRFPLCTSRSNDDIEIELSCTPSWRRYVCQVQCARDGQIRLRLPAGRLDLSGSRWLLAFADQCLSANAPERDGRELRFAGSAATEFRAGALVALYNVDSPADGRHVLRDGAHVLLDKLSAVTVRELQQSLLQSRELAGAR